MKVKFTIPGEPQGKGRPRFSRQGNNVVTHTPDQTLVYENLVRTMYMKYARNYRFPDDVPLDVRVYAYYTIPKSISKKKHQEMLDKKIRPMKKPDFDNIGKVICDSLNGVAYRDDAQVVDAQVRKFYSDEPRVVVTIQEASLGGE